MAPPGVYEVAYCFSLGLRDFVTPKMSAVTPLCTLPPDLSQLAGGEQTQSGQREAVPHLVQ